MSLSQIQDLINNDSASSDRSVECLELLETFYTALVACTIASPALSRKLVDLT